MVKLEMSYPDFLQYLKNNSYYTDHIEGHEHQSWRQIKDRGKVIGEVEYIGNDKYRITIDEGNAQPRVNTDPV